MDPSIYVALIMSIGGIIVSLITARASSGKAVLAATAPMIADIARYREFIVELGGDPDEA